MIIKSISAKLKCILLLCLITSVPVYAQWNPPPSAGLSGPFGPQGPDRICDTPDDFDGTNNSPDLRGPDGVCGTADDLQFYQWGTGNGGGNAGCFTNNVPNCVGDIGAKSAEWSLNQIVDAPNCTITTTLTNTSNGEPACPNRGCITAQWNSPRLPNLQTAVRAALDIAPGVSVTATEAPPRPGATNCTPRPATYSMGWNPDTDNEEHVVLELPPTFFEKYWLVFAFIVVLLVAGFFTIRHGKGGEKG